MLKKNLFKKIGYLVYIMLALVVPNNVYADKGLTKEQVKKITSDYKANHEKSYSQKKLNELRRNIQNKRNAPSGNKKRNTGGGGVRG